LNKNAGNEGVFAGETVAKFFFGHGRVVHLGTGRLFVVFDDDGQLGRDDLADNDQINVVWPPLEAADKPAGEKSEFDKAKFAAIGNEILTEGGSFDDNGKKRLVKGVGVAKLVVEPIAAFFIFDHALLCHPGEFATDGVDLFFGGPGEFADVVHFSRTGKEYFDEFRPDAADHEIGEFSHT